jgi:hypothetical protein
MRPQLNSGTLGGQVEMFATGRARAIVMGVMSLPCGLAVGLHLRLFASTNPDYRDFYLYSSVAAFVAPALTWWWLVERSRRFSTAMGIVAGAVGTMLAHHLTWQLALLVVNLRYWISGTVSTRPLDPVSGFFGTFVLTAISLVFYGWITLPFGMTAGALLSKRLVN